MRVAIAGLLVGFEICAARAEPISAADARVAAGREVTVRGVVTQLGQVPPGRGPLVLELDGEPRASVFRVIIPSEVLPQFGENIRREFRDREVSVTGRIALHGNVPQIVVGDAAQIVVGDSPPSGLDAERRRESEPQSATWKSSPSDPAKQPPNLLKNGDFSDGTRPWKLARGVKVANGVLRIPLDPDKAIRVQQTFSGIPADAIQFQALFRAQLTEGASLAKPLMLRLGPTLGQASYLARPVNASPGEWVEIKWTRTADLKGYARLTFFLDAGPGEGELLIDDIVVFAHPDWKDKRTWKPSDG